MLKSKTLHFFSQLCYLDAVPAMDKGSGMTVATMADYYLTEPLGMAYINNRFSDIPEESVLWSDFLETASPEFSEWLIEDIFDDNRPGQTGFYGCTYRSPEGESVVAFRGSELLGNRYYKNDYVTDLALSYLSPTPQQARVDDYWARYGRTRYGELAVTGHSLGGNLALYAAIMAPARIREQITICAAFNAPGFNKEFIEKQRDRVAAAAPCIVLYQNKFDPVSSMLDNVVPPAVIASRVDPTAQDEATIRDIFYPHSNFMYETDEYGELIADPSEEKCSFCNMVHTLSDLFQLLPKKTRKDICDAALAALYAAPSPEKRARYMLDAVLKYMAHHEDEMRVSGLDSAVLAYAAAMMDGMPVHALYKPLVAGKGKGKTQAPSLVRALMIVIGMFGDLASGKKALANTNIR
ncbi:MAG: DUF2974 domain-containing protein [Oscillospiraceae bacterium]|jgi:pimeloyl-ACP methyl ester carboxylesterase|nr:DUF2974 domain-containing protein [Oscillospiraceae bacterium]